MLCAKPLNKLRPCWQWIMPTNYVYNGFWFWCWFLNIFAVHSHIPHCLISFIPEYRNAQLILRFLKSSVLTCTAVVFASPLNFTSIHFMSCSRFYNMVIVQYVYQLFSCFNCLVRPLQRIWWQVWGTVRENGQGTYILVWMLWHMLIFSCFQSTEDEGEPLKRLDNIF